MRGNWGGSLSEETVTLALIKGVVVELGRRAGVVDCVSEAYGNWES